MKQNKTRKSRKYSYVIFIVGAKKKKEKETTRNDKNQPPFATRLAKRVFREKRGQLFARNGDARSRGAFAGNKTQMCRK